LKIKVFVLLIKKKERERERESEKETVPKLEIRVLTFQKWKFKNSFDAELGSFYICWFH